MKGVLSKPFVITQPGLYIVAEDIAFAPIVAAAMITIDSDDVCLNLCCYTLSQSNNVLGVQGIVVNPSHKNIVIRNGHVRDMTQEGILVKEGCQVIILHDLIVKFCGQRNNIPVALVDNSGIGFVGIGAAIITDVTLRKCQSIGTQSTQNCFGLRFTWVNKCHIEDCVGSETVALGARCAGLRNTDVNDIDILRCQFNRNQGALIAHGHLSGGATNSAFLFEECVAFGNKAITGVANARSAGYGGSRINGATFRRCTATRSESVATEPLGVNGAAGWCIIDWTDVLFEDCTASKITTAGNHSHGMHILRCTNVLLRNCQVMDIKNTVTDGHARGFTTERDDRPGAVTTNICFENCVVKQVQADVTFSSGFEVTNQHRGTYRNCLVQDCVGPGFQIRETGPGARGAGTTRNCYFENNVSNSNSTFGFIDTTALALSNNVYIANNAYNNTTANFSGLPGGTPIRTWTIGAAPAATNNNGILDKMDNIDISP